MTRPGIDTAGKGLYKEVCCRNRLPGWIILPSEMPEEDHEQAIETRFSGSSTYMRKMNKIKTVMVAFLLCPLLLAGGPQSSELVVSAQHPAVIVLPAKADPVVHVGANALARYISAVTGVAPKSLAPSEESTGQVSIVFSLADLPYTRPDGYRLEVIGEPGRETIRITAPAMAGLKYGAYRLIREMDQLGKQLHVPRLRVDANPWVKTRELFIAEIEWHPTEGEKKVLGDLRQTYDWPH